MRLILLAFFSFITSTFAFAHNIGTISGEVTDIESSEAIIGANIFIDKTMLGTTTDLDGRFELKNLHVGNYTLVISYIGYKSQQLNVDVFEDKSTIVNVQMELASIELDPYAVQAERAYSAASYKYIRKIDLEIRPNKSSQDLLKLVPGLITAQHAGGGKAEQIFLRGFDADHGTDVNISVDGIPVNMVTHAHGHGYADLHFLIPELVDEIDVYKGPYFAEFGNFATAGSVSFKTKEILEDNLIKLEAGGFNSLKATMLYQLDNGSAEQNAYIASQYYRTDGPFERPGKMGRMNLYGKYYTVLGHNSKLTFSMGSFTSSWDASGQIPQRAIDQGYISRFGAIDDMEGGITGRTNFNLLFDRRDEYNNKLAIQAYYSDCYFKLFSNFTFFLNDPVNGDMIEQLEARQIHGLNTNYSIIRKPADIIYKTTMGGGYRADNINVSLWHSPKRIRKTEFSDVSVAERNLFIYIQEEFVFSSKLRLMGGLRMDYFTFDVNDHLASSLDTIGTGLPHASGFNQQHLISPKFSAVYSPNRTIELFFNSGIGFHSNDARNIIFAKKASELEHIWAGEGASDQEIDERLASLNFDPGIKNAINLPKAIGVEAGARFRFLNRLDIGMAAWYLHLEREFVFVGDGGYSELSDPTQRIGIDMEGRLKYNSWLWLDVDICLSEGKILNLPVGENNIPLAPGFTSSGGISLINYNGFNASLRYIYVDDRPANETNSVIARGYSLLNAGASYNWKSLTFSVTLENIFNAKWNEAQFDTESRLPWENEAVSEIHFTPGNPRNLQLGISLKF
ncbi:MAG: TonB-dependent receptor [Bacteroidales bacterium]|nr:TonB-dependent receptor [Bacteroidales bacterium]MCF8404618.1 TonB-dependent receptor [Bacteroidales bacterium]